MQMAMAVSLGSDLSVLCFVRQVKGTKADEVSNFKKIGAWRAFFCLYFNIFGTEIFEYDHRCFQFPEMILFCG